MDKTIIDVFKVPAVKPWKSKITPEKCSNDDLLIGLELEIETIDVRDAGDGPDWFVERGGGFWSAEEDGSLRPRWPASAEFLSRPATIGVTLAELRAFFKKFGFTDANYSDRTSVHVHTNVQDFTQAQLANLALVYPIFEPILFQFVNHHRKREEQGYCRDTNLYCIPWSDCRMNRNFIEKFFDNPTLFVQDRRGLGVRSWEKYTALNFMPISSLGTVEWRHMHGTSDMEKLTPWLNMIGSIMKFCKGSKFDDIVKTIKAMNDVSNYQQFFLNVLGGVLEYSEEYRLPMAEGVVNSKYSLINWEANKGKEKKAAPAGLQWVTIDEDVWTGTPPEAPEAGNAAGLVGGFRPVREAHADDDLVAQAQAQGEAQRAHDRLELFRAAEVAMRRDGARWVGAIPVPPRMPRPIPAEAPRNPIRRNPR